MHYLLFAILCSALVVDIQSVTSPSVAVPKGFHMSLQRPKEDRKKAMIRSQLNCHNKFNCFIKIRLT